MQFQFTTFNFQNRGNGGYAAVTATLVVLAISLIVIGGFSFFTLQEVKVNRAFTKSTESRAIAESGIEDAIYRIVSGKQFSSGEELGVGNGTTTITLTTQGSQRIIRSEGLREFFQKNLRTEITVSTQAVNFNYGVQVGDGGIVMDNNAQVNGSVYSNGSIIGAPGATITGDAVVAEGNQTSVNQSWETQNADYAVGKSDGSAIVIVDSSGDAGAYNAVALGSDGFARISYYDGTGKDLEFARCLDAECTIKNLATVDSSGDVGYRYTSLALGSDGFARISYYYNTGNDLKFVRCLDADCAGKNIASIDTSGDVGQFSSLALGSDGFARISYYSVTSGNLKFIRCLDADCSSRNTATVESTNDIGKYTSLALGSDGFARIGYRDETNDDLRFARCLDADCTSANVTAVDTAGNVADYPTSIALGSDGFARIAYYDATNADLKFARCTNTDCTASVITAVDTGGNVGRYASLKLGSDGFGRISYYDASNGAVKFAQCLDADCTTKNISTVDGTNDTGHYTALALGSDGFGRISYYDYTAEDLKFIRCLAANCPAPDPYIDVAQSFQPSSNARIVRVDLLMKKIGSPANATVRLVRDSAGAPSTNPADVLTTATLSTSGITGSYAWQSLVFGTKPTLTANTTYWILVDAALDNANYLVWGGDSASGYGAGAAKRSSDWSIGGWQSIPADLDFKVHMGGTNNTITSVTVGDASNGTAYADDFVSSTVHGAACPNQYCIRDQPQPKIALPISATQIQDFKTEATAGGVIGGDYSVTEDVSLGPKEITGDLLIDANNKTLTVTGTLYVRGNVSISNGSTVRCSASYGMNSCVVIADGWIHVQNNGIFSGSGQSGSFIMFLSTLACDGTSALPPCDTGDHNGAIDLHNNALGAIFYASQGLLNLHNGVNITEATAYKLHLDQTAQVTYDQGLANTRFTAGPSGGYDITAWEEVE